MMLVKTLEQMERANGLRQFKMDEVEEEEDEVTREEV